MRVRTSLGIAGTVGSILAISWLSVAIACACITARAELAWELNLSLRESELTVPVIQAAFNKKYKGQQLLSLPPLKTGRDEECRRVSEPRLDCENWLKSGLLWREGLLVSYFTDANGTVERVEVSDTLGWNVGWITHLSLRKSN